MSKSFELGRVVVTRAIDERMKEDTDFSNFVKLSLGKYIEKDWGDTCEEDALSNEEALEDGDRIFAVYTYAKTKELIWIITEWDRSVTTILFPSDY